MYCKDDVFTQEQTCKQNLKYFDSLRFSVESFIPSQLLLDKTTEKPLMGKIKHGRHQNHTHLEQTGTSDCHILMGAGE